MNYHQRMGILSLKKRVNRDKCGLVCLGSLLSLRFFAIDEPRSPACALFATLFHNLFSLKNHKKWSYCPTADTVWTLLQRSTLPSTLILPSGKPRKQSHLSLEGRAQLKKVVIIDYICTNLQKNNWTRADWVLGQHCWLNKQIGCHDQHLLHTLSLTTHKISSRAVTAVDSMKKSGRFEWQEFFQHPSLYYLQFFSSNHYLFSWPELSLSKCSEFNSENPVVRELDLVAALKVFFNMRAIIRIE